MTGKRHLLVLEGASVHRYEGAQRLESAALDEGAGLSPEWAEHFRANGLPEDEPAPEPKEPGEVAFERLVEQLENDPPKIVIVEPEVV
jgi:hypothetical protein